MGKQVKFKGRLRKVYAVDRTGSKWTTLSQRTDTHVKSRRRCQVVEIPEDLLDTDKPEFTVTVQYLDADEAGLPSDEWMLKGTGRMASWYFRNHERKPIRDPPINLLNTELAIDEVAERVKRAVETTTIWYLKKTVLGQHDGDPKAKRIGKDLLEYVGEEVAYVNVPPDPGHVEVETPPTDDDLSGEEVWDLT